MSKLGYILRFRALGTWLLGDTIQPLTIRIRMTLPHLLSSDHRCLLPGPLRQPSRVLTRQSPARHGTLRLALPQFCTRLTLTQTSPSETPSLTRMSKPFQPTSPAPSSNTSPCYFLHSTFYYIILFFSFVLFCLLYSTYYYLELYSSVSSF